MAATVSCTAIVSRTRTGRLFNQDHTESRIPSRDSAFSNARSVLVITNSWELDHGLMTLRCRTELMKSTNSMMIESNEIAETIWFGCVAVIVTIAMVTDYRSRRIPNWLTASAFLSGICYQLCMHGLAGMVDASTGFGIGFSLLFGLWLLGGGGGGDVKLIASLAVWLGARQTIWVLVGSAALIAFCTFVVFCYRLVTYYSGRSAGRFAAGPLRFPSARLVVPYALPVGCATWAILLVHIKLHFARH